MPWDLAGNPGTNPPDEFLGTTDEQPLAIRANGTEWMRVTPAGNVGIGTPNPGRTLDIAAAVGSTELVIRDSSQPQDQRAWRFMNNSTRLAIEAVNDALTGGTNVINFTRAGDVGIGTAQPGAKLDVVGDVKLRPATGDPMDVTIGAGGNGVLHTRHINGKDYQSDADDTLFLNWSTGMPVWLGFGEGTTSSLRVSGDVEVHGDISLPGADCAEEFDVAEAGGTEPGTVVVVDKESILRQSHKAYDKRVAGVVSGADGYRPGLILDKRESRPDRVPVALLGKVSCKVDAQYGPVEVGDLLTTSPTPGHAMKANDPIKAFGAVLGKALRPLKVGQQIIPILVALQ